MTAWNSTIPPTSASGPVVRALRRALSDWGGDGTVYVGYSGGLDSTVLLHGAHALWPERVVAIHVNHGLQQAASAFDEHCRQQCERLGVVLRVHAANVPETGNTEAAARAERYGWFGQVVSKHDVLWLAHHRDDQVETLMLRLMQGRGFYGMPRSRLLLAGAASGLLQRPLLDLPRTMLRAYAADADLEWVEDPSNAELDKDRNWLRHRLLPELRERTSDLDQSLLDALQQQRHLELGLLQARGGEPHRVAVASLPEDRKAAVQALRVWLSSRSQLLPRTAALEDFVAQLGAPSDRQPLLTLGGGNSLRRYGGYVHLVRALPELESHYPMALPGQLTLPHGELRVLGATDGFHPDGPVRVEFVGAHPGLRIRCRGKHHAVRALLQAARVPPWQRNDYPLLLDDRGPLAVPGIAHRDHGGAAGRLFDAGWHQHAQLR